MGAPVVAAHGQNDRGWAGIVAMVVMMPETHANSLHARAAWDPPVYLIVQTVAWMTNLNGHQGCLPLIRKSKRIGSWIYDHASLEG